MKRSINSMNSPKAIGPYSHAIETGGFLYFLSGQLPIDMDTNIIPESINQQTHNSIKNVIRVLNACGCAIDDVVKTTLFITSMNDFQEINTIYSSYFKEPYPARSCVEVHGLPRGSKIEIEVIASKGKID